MISGKDQKIIWLEARKKVGKKAIEFFEALAKSGRITSMPEQHIEVFKVSEDKGVIGF